MSTTNEGNDNNGIEGQGGVPYATYNDKVGLAQVIGIVAPRDIAVYADGKAMHTGTKEVLARCGGNFGAMKDLTLPGGTAAGVWSYARPTDPEKQPEFYSREMTEVPLNGYGVQGGIVLSGDWKIPTMTVIIELVAAIRLWNETHATEYIVCFEPDASRMGKDFKEKSVIGSSMPVELIGLALRNLAQSSYGSLKVCRISRGPVPASCGRGARDDLAVAGARFSDCLHGLGHRVRA